MTGSVVHHLLRAVYLSKAGHALSLVLLLLDSPEDERIVYPIGTLCLSAEKQARVIVTWAVMMKNDDRRYRKALPETVYFCEPFSAPPQIKPIKMACRQYTIRLKLREIYT